VTPADLVGVAAKIAERWPDADVRYSPMGRLCVYLENNPAPVAVLDPSGVLDVWGDGVVNHDEGDEAPD
jgi:hypothetical protein